MFCSFKAAHFKCHTIWSYAGNASGLLSFYGTNKLNLSDLSFLRYALSTAVSEINIFHAENISKTNCYHPRYENCLITIHITFVFCASHALIDLFLGRVEL
ncbi:hypothetical protein FKM82_006366 [Ascaphus truei]